MRHLKFALRTLFKTPFVTIVAIVSLALGIGANTAIFSMFNQLLLRPLPVQRPHELVNLKAPGPKPGGSSCNQAGGCDEVFSYPMFRDLEKAQTVFTGLAAHVVFGANLSARGQTLSGSAMMVSGSYFPTLGITPALGRLFTPEDDATIGEPPIVVLSHAYWQARFASDPEVIGQPMIVNGKPLTIVGVAPAGFDGTTLGERPRIYVPLTMRTMMQPNSSALDNRRSYWAYLFARLKPGVSIEQARTAINVPYKSILNDVEAPLQKGMSGQTMERFKARQVEVWPGARGQSSLTKEARAPLFLLFAVTAFVLLIACANIANLLLARSAARASEMAVRLSLGATRRQLVGQLLSESCLLAAFGGIAGIFVARWTMLLMLSMLPAEAQDFIQTGIDPGVMLFAAALAVGTGVLFGLYPALHSTRSGLIGSIKNQAGQPSGSRSASRFRTTLATVQIALSMALLVSAGLFTRSLMNVSRVNLGLNIENVVAFGVSPQLNGYEPARSRQFFERLEESLRALPGATAVTAARVPLLGGSNWGSSVRVEGFDAGPDTDTESRYNQVGPGYFSTMGITLLSGREFTAADALGAPRVAIVNEAFAKKFNLGRDAVGKRMADGTRGGGEKRDGPLDVEIVGLVRNAKYSDVKAEIPPLFFNPYRQDERVGNMYFYVRTALDAEEFLANIPKVVAQIDPNLPVEDLRTLPQQVRENVFLDRFISVLSTGFASLATLLAAIGLYGVLAYTVAQRTREIGLRMALGAAPARVRAMVLRQVAWMTIVGGAIGLAFAVAIGQLASSLLYQLDGYDPTVLAAATVSLTLVALGAGLIPALRASKVEPMRALRYE
jgi:predicted permease